MVVPREAHHCLIRRNHAPTTGLYSTGIAKKMLQGCYRSVADVSQGYLKFAVVMASRSREKECVTGDVKKVSQGCYSITVDMMSQRCFKGGTGCHRGVTQVM
jgi:hypothetical protein